MSILYGNIASLWSLEPFLAKKFDTASIQTLWEIIPLSSFFCLDNYLMVTVKNTNLRVEIQVSKIWISSPYLVFKDGFGFTLAAIIMLCHILTGNYCNLQEFEFQKLQNFRKLTFFWKSKILVWRNILVEKLFRGLL